MTITRLAIEGEYKENCLFAGLAVYSGDREDIQEFPARISCKIFPQNFPTRFSRKNFPQGFPTRISCKIFPQEFPARFSHKIFPQGFPTRICHKIFPQNFQTRFSHKIFRQDFPTRISHKIFPQEFPTRFSCKILLSWILIGWLPITLFQMLNFHQSLLCLIEGVQGQSVQVGNTTFMRFMKCQLRIITMLLYPHKLLIVLYYLDNICWWRCQCRLIRNASIVCYQLAPKLSAKDFCKMASGPTVNLKNFFLDNFNTIWIYIGPNKMYVMTEL